MHRARQDQLGRGLGIVPMWKVPQFSNQCSCALEKIFKASPAWRETDPVFRPMTSYTGWARVNPPAGFFLRLGSDGIFDVLREDLVAISFFFIGAHRPSLLFFLSALA